MCKLHYFFLKFSIYLGKFRNLPEISRKYVISTVLGNLKLSQGTLMYMALYAIRIAEYLFQNFLKRRRFKKPLSFACRFKPFKAISRIYRDSTKLATKFIGESLENNELL